MKKIFKGFRVKHFITHLLLCLAYPIIKTSISTNKMLVFSDTSFIMSLLFIFAGVFYNASLKGDYDIHEYVAVRSFFKKQNQDLRTFINTKNEKREERFNYLLFVGIIVLIVAIITSIFA